MSNPNSFKRHWSFVVTDKKYLYPFVFLITLLGVIAALYFGEPTYFSRTGSFVIGIGVWMSMRYTLREGINKHKDMKKLSPHVPVTNQLNIDFLNEITFSLGDAKLQLHGFFIVIYGSFIGSFGDLVLQYVLSKC